MIQPAPVCVRCRCEMECTRNGYAVINGEGIWQGDKYTCPGCGTEIVTGFGQYVYAEPHVAGYETDVDRILAAGQGVRLEEGQ